MKKEKELYVVMQVGDYEFCKSHCNDWLYKYTVEEGYKVLLKHLEGRSYENKYYVSKLLKEYIHFECINNCFCKDYDYNKTKGVINKIRKYMKENIREEPLVSYEKIKFENDGNEEISTTTKIEASGSDIIFYGIILVCIVIFSCVLLF